MDEKPKKNPKYEDVPGRLDTGPTTKKVLLLSRPSLTSGDKNVAKRRAEVFYRIDSAGLISLLEIEKNPESIYNMGSDSPHKDNVSVNGKQQSIKTTKIEQQFKIEITDSTDFILVDLRPEDEYAKYHIKDSHNFPASLIPRDKYPQQMYLLKNKPNKLIVVIHEDERLGVQFAAALYQKGFDNVYLVTGGMEEFYQKHPDWVTGTQLPVLKSDIGNSTELT